MTCASIPARNDTGGHEFDLRLRIRSKEDQYHKSFSSDFHCGGDRPGNRLSRAEPRRGVSIERVDRCQSGERSACSDPERRRFAFTWMAGMVQASTSAAFTADKVRAGTVLAAEMIAAAAVLIATAAAIRLMGERRKPKGAGAAEPHTSLTSRPPLRGGRFFGGAWTRPARARESYADGRRPRAHHSCSCFRRPSGGVRLGGSSRTTAEQIGLSENGCCPHCRPSRRHLAMRRLARFWAIAVNTVLSWLASCTS